MFRSLAFVVSALAAVTVALQDLSAAPDVAAPAGRSELVVYEARESPYSQIFRDTLLPSIRMSSTARNVPVRFIDVLKTSDDGGELAEPIAMVPTLVLFRDGREEGRIAGLFGPSEYRLLLAGLLRGDH